MGGGLSSLGGAIVVGFESWVGLLRGWVRGGCVAFEWGVGGRRCVDGVGGVGGRVVGSGHDGRRGRGEGVKYKTERTAR